MMLRKLIIAAFALSVTGAIAGGDKHQKQAQGTNATNATPSSMASTNAPSQGALSSTNSAAAMAAAPSQGTNGSNGSSADSSRIQQVQQALKDKGHDPGQIDGKLGPNTKSALKSFQQAQGLQASGDLDGQTLAALGVQGDGASPSQASLGAGTNMAASSSPGMGGTNQPSSSGTNQPSSASTNQAPTERQAKGQ